PSPASGGRRTAWAPAVPMLRCTPLASSPCPGLRGIAPFKGGSWDGGAFPQSPMHNRPMADYIVGLTGGVASGKSEVTRRFEALGVTVADADVAARDAVAVGSE